MKLIKRIIAMAGVIVIVALYVITIVLAIFGNENSLPMLKASFAATIVVPVLLWAYTFIYNLLKKYYGPGDDESK